MSRIASYFAIHCRSALSFARLQQLALAGIAWSCSLSMLHGQIPVAEINHPEPVDFATEILPVLQRNCLACHSSSVAEGELVLETPDAMLKGGNEGPAIVPGNADESYLFQLAAHQSEPVMPPAGNKANASNLTSEELGLLKLWINQGATKGSLGQNLVSFEPLPPGIHPVYSVGFSPDGRTVAAARANQVFLYDVPSRLGLGRLTDPALLERGIYERPGVADIDLVQCLQFSPDGSRLAIGGYRSVKFWKRQVPGIVHGIDLPAAVRAMSSTADGAMVVVALDGNQLVLINTAEGAVSETIPGPEFAVEQLAISSDAASLLALAGTQMGLYQKVDGQWQMIARTDLEAAAVQAMHLPIRGLWGVACADHKIRLFGPAPAPAAEGEQAQAWTPVAQLENHGQPISAMSTSVAPVELVSADASGHTVFWNLDNNQPHRTVNHGSPVRAVSVDAAAKRVLTFGDQQTIRVWNTDDGQAVGSNDGNWNLQFAVGRAQQAVALANRMVEVANQDLKAAQDQKTAEETNLNAAKEAVTKATEEVNAKQAAYDPLGTARDQAVAAAEAAKVKVAEIEAAIATAEAERVAAEAKVNELNQKVEALAADPAQAEALEAAKKEQEAAQATLTAATTRKNELAATLPPAQEELKKAEEGAKAASDAATKAMDELVAAQRTLEGATRTAERAAEAVQRAIDAIPGREAEVARRNELKAAREAEANSATETFNGQRPMFVASTALPGSGQCVALTADGQWTAVTTAAGSPLFAGPLPGEPNALPTLSNVDSAGRVWMARGNQVLALGTQAQWEWERTIGDYQGDSPFVDRVTSIDFSPDGSLLAVAGGVPSRGGTITLVQVETGEVVREFPEPHSDVVLSIRFSPEGDRVASAGTDRFARIFDVATGEHVKNFEGHTHHVQSVAWSSDGRTLVTAGSDSVIKVWNALTGEQLRTVQGFGKETTGVRFVGLSTQVAVSCGDRNVHVKNSADGGNVRQLGGFADYVYCVDVSWDGKQFVGGSLDGQVRVWKEDGNLLAEFGNPEPQE